MEGLSCLLHNKWPSIVERDKDRYEIGKIMKYVPHLLYGAKFFIFEQLPIKVFIDDSVLKVGQGAKEVSNLTFNLLRVE